MIAWPESLIEDMARRRAIVYVGAGVSKNSEGKDGKRPPDWKGFLNECLTRCDAPKAHIEALIDEEDLLTACELLKSRLQDDWNDLLSAEFSDPEYRPAPIHHHIHKLDLRLILTPNFDKIYDVYAQQETGGSTKVKNYYDTDIPLSLRRSHRSILKVHGSIDEPSRTIFTRSEYAEARTKHRAFQGIIDAVLLTHTFVFLGSSLADPDLRLFLENHAFSYPGSPPHYMTVSSDWGHDEIDQSLRQNLNLRILRYDPAANHQSLADSLAVLAGEVESARDQLLSTRNW